MQSYFSFAKKKGELVDSVLSRFSTIYNRAHKEGGLTISQAGRAYKLMEVLGLQNQELLVFLSPFDGALPATDEQYNDFIEHVRRYYQRHEQQKPNYTATVMPEDDEDYESWAPDAWWGDDEDTYLYGEDEEIDEEYTHLGNPTDDEHVPEDEESQYLAFLAARRRFRYFSKGKGKAKGKGKSKTTSQRSSSAYPAYKGKGNKGGKPRNPVGRDGQVLRCSICMSPDHLRAQCPRGQSSNHPFQGKGKSSSASTSQQTTWTTWMVNQFFASLEPRLPSGEGLLLDTGCVKNLTGTGWIGRAQHVRMSDDGDSSLLHGVGGAGTPSKGCASVPLAVRTSADDLHVVFKTKVADQQDIPALLGLESLERMGAVLDCRRGLLMLPKPGCEMKVVDVGQTIKLEKSPSKHLMIPVEGVSKVLCAMENTHSESCHGPESMSQE
eukprot:6491381-Amphidinium_carterae.2